MSPLFPKLIHTPRLLLRPPTLDDADAIYRRYATDPEVVKYLTWKAHRSVDETRAFLETQVCQWEDGTAYPWVITRRSDGHLLGMMAARPEGDEVSFGYVLAREEWGRGYMTEALTALVKLALSIPSVSKVWAIAMWRISPQQR